MSATIEPMAIATSLPEAPPAPAAAIIIAQLEVQSAQCDCCGLTEDCTPAYIDRIRSRFAGKWICGLCSEAVKDEILRSELSTEEAMDKHMSFCKKFSASTEPPPDPTVHLIAAMRQILRRSLDSPTAVRSAPSSPVRSAGKVRRRGLSRSESCFSPMSG